MVTICKDKLFKRKDQGFEQENAFYRLFFLSKRIVFNLPFGCSIQLQQAGYRILHFSSMNTASFPHNRHV